MSAESDPSSTTRPIPHDYASPTTERASTAWSQEDDTRLMQLRAQNMNWGPIATHFPSKTANACRKRHERLMEKKNFENWDGIKVEDLARAYLECRETMWKILANHLGEKWQTVEMKCMEKGLKTLQTAGRAARRQSARPSSPDISQRSISDLDDPLFSYSHSPSVAPSHLPPPNPQPHQAPSPMFSQGLAPRSGQRTGSLSSASSVAGSIPQPTHPHQSQGFSFSSTQQQPSHFNSATANSSSYMPPGSFGNVTFSPTSTSGYPTSLPSFSRGFEAHSRSTLPPLPSLLPTSRSHQEVTTASY